MILLDFRPPAATATEDSPHAHAIWKTCCWKASLPAIFLEKLFSSLFAEAIKLQAALENRRACFCITLPGEDVCARWYVTCFQQRPRRTEVISPVLRV